MAVHAYTASGALLAWLALHSAWADAPREALLWLSVAVFVDATDGFAARAADVRRYAGHIDGARLDDIVDYLTYVFVPLAVLWESGLIGGTSGLIAVGAVLIASAFGFTNLRAKTDDHFFTGFPSYWNLIAVYALAWGWSLPATTGVLLALAALVFVPIRYVYPSRTVTMMPVTLALGAVWSVLMLLTIWHLPEVAPWLLWSGLVYPIYYVALSLWLTARPAAR